MSSARTHKSTIYFRAEIQKYFRSFLVQMKTLKFAFEIYWPLPTSWRLVNIVKERPPYTVHTALHVKSMLKIHSASSFTNVRVNEGSCIYVGKPLLYCCNKKMYCDGISNKKSCILFCVPEQSWLKSSFALCSFNFIKVNYSLDNI